MRSTVAICCLLASLAWSGPEAPVILKIKNERAHDIVLKNLESKEEVTIPPDGATFFEVFLRNANSWQLHYSSGLFSELNQNLGELLKANQIHLLMLELTLQRSEPGIFSSTYSVKDRVGTFHTDVDITVLMDVLPQFLATSSYFVPTRQHLHKPNFGWCYIQLKALQRQLSQDKTTVFSLTLNQMSHLLSIVEAKERADSASAASAARQ